MAEQFHVLRWVEELFCGRAILCEEAVLWGSRFVVEQFESEKFLCGETVL